MKKILFIIACLLIFSLITDAQYRLNKLKYNPAEYSYQSDDRYNPNRIAIASGFVTGFGQRLAGEYLRSFAFMTGAGISWGAFVIGSFNYGYDDPASKAAMILGIAGVIGFKVWSVTDAINVAKVNNMAWRDEEEACQWIFNLM